MAPEPPPWGFKTYFIFKYEVLAFKNCLAPNKINGAHRCYCLLKTGKGGGGIMTTPFFLGCLSEDLYKIGVK